MKINLKFNDDTSSLFEDVDVFAMCDYTLEIKHYNGTSRCIARDFIKEMEVNRCNGNILRN